MGRRLITDHWRLNMDLIEIFKTGTHTDSAGKTREWTDKDLEEIASLYRPENHEAPIVIGHPEHDSPAYGWVGGLKFEGGKLLAKVKDVADEFKDWVRKGLYKKVSIALYPDLTLRHVGFLGAMPPAVKGLRQAAFGDQKAAWEIETDFCNKEHDAGVAPAPLYSNKGGIKMTFKEFLEKMKGLFVEAEKELGGTPVSPPITQFTEADIQAAEKRGKEAHFAELDKERKERVESQKKLAEIETKARRDTIHIFCEGMAKDGKLIPAWQKMGIEEFLFSLDSGGNMKFAEDQDKPQSQWFMDFLAEIPKVVTFKEFTPKDGPGASGSAGEKLLTLTKQKMSEKKISYGAAFAEVQKENTELANEIAEEIRGGRERK